MKVGIIGSGNMAVSLIKGFRTEKKNKIICSDIDIKKLNILKKIPNIRTTSDNLEVVRNSEIIFLCVKPDKVKFVLKEIKQGLGSKKLLISIAAGVKTSFIQNELNLKSKIIRTMPNLPCLVLAGVFGYRANKNCTSNDLRNFLNLVQTVGTAIKVPKESDFDYVTALSGSGPAFLGEFINAQLVYAKTKGISSKLAKQLILNTIVGTSKYLSETLIKPEEFVKMVSSPGGTTEAGIRVLKNKKFENIIIKCLNSASSKSKKISKKLK